MNGSKRQYYGMYMYVLHSKHTMSPQQISHFKSNRSSVLSYLYCELNLSSKSNLFKPPKASQGGRDILSYLYCELNLSSRSNLFKPSKASQGGRDIVLHLNSSLHLCASTIKKHTFPYNIYSFLSLFCFTSNSQVREWLSTSISMCYSNSHFTNYLALKRTRRFVFES
jgi:hypothetical protein